MFYNIILFIMNTKVKIKNLSEKGNYSAPL